MRAVVTGGGGFLGGALVRRLVSLGASVGSVARGSYPALDRLGVDVVRGDLTDPAVARLAVAGADVVFHVAARAGVAGRARDFWAANVTGTANVIEACRVLGVPRLVHTSTPSVVHTGRDLVGVDETVPYATRFESAYPATKAEAERLVLAANDDTLSTLALRPHLVWGPGDTQLVPRILDRARRGRLRLVAGGRAVVDTTYIDDAVDAHLLAADALAPSAACAGRAYFISSGEPLPVAELVTRILAAADLPPVTASVPYPVAYVAGGLAEIAFHLTGRTGEPPMTRFLARQLATTHWFDISAARRDFGYAPRVGVDQGFERLARWLSESTATAGGHGPVQT